MCWAGDPDARTEALPIHHCILRLVNFCHFVWLGVGFCNRNYHKTAVLGACLSRKVSSSLGGRPGRPQSRAALVLAAMGVGLGRQVGAWRRRSQSQSPGRKARQRLWLQPGEARVSVCQQLPESRRTSCDHEARAVKTQKEAKPKDAKKSECRLLMSLLSG